MFLYISRTSSPRRYSVCPRDDIPLYIYTTIARFIECTWSPLLLKFSNLLLTSKPESAPASNFETHHHRWIETRIIVQKTAKSVSNWPFFTRVNFKNDRWPQKTTANIIHDPRSYACHFITIQIVTIWKCSNQSQIVAFLACATLRFGRWPWKTIDPLFHVPWSCMCHFIAIHEFKLELSSVNAHIGAKLSIFWLMWPWNMTDEPKKYREPILCQFKLLVAIYEFKLELQSGNDEIALKLLLSSMTLTFIFCNKPTTWCKSGRVSLVSSSCLYKWKEGQDHSQSCLVTAKNLNACPTPGVQE